MIGRMAMVATMLMTDALAGCTTEPVERACSDDVLLTENVNVILETTMGNITIELFADKAPDTASNFAALARDGHLDDVPFHRIISDFMMQGGDYTMGNGRGGAAHPSCDADGDGNIPDEFHPDLKHDQKGMLSMANAGAGTGGSQFFITFAPTAWLDGYDANGNLKDCQQRFVSCHPVFGQVVDGMDVLDRVNQEAGTQSGTPAQEVTLISATVLE